jgi:HprK-related kinase A
MPGPVAGPAGMPEAALQALSTAQIAHALRGEGLSLRVADFRCLVQSSSARLAEPLRLLYAAYEASDTVQGFYDFRLQLDERRAWFGAACEVEFRWRGHPPMPPLPASQAHPLFEWGLNWSVATLCGADIVAHAAVLARNGRAIVLPGQPGAGKSTLCAALALSGWRLLSDELTILARDSGHVMGVPRPISLKEASIDVIRSLFPDAVLSEPVRDTRKGAIAYVRPPDASVQAGAERVPVGFIVFPIYRSGSGLSVEPISRAQALARVLDQTFNVGLLGAQGFEQLARVVAGAACYTMTYDDMPRALAWIGEQMEAR